MPAWTVPPMWHGKTVAILASGPSMSSEVAELIRRSLFPTIAVNTTFRLAPWADVIYGADVLWWEHHAREVAPLAAIKVCCDAVANVAGLRYLKNTGKVGFDKDPSCTRTGGNSGFQAIHLALHAHAARILLCGFDLRGGHWHGKHPEPLRNAGEGIYGRWLPLFAALADEANERGTEILNCTPGSALTLWPQVNLEEVLFVET